MDKHKDIFIRKLGPENAEELSLLLQSADPGYSRYFIPFKFDRQTIAGILASARQDRYFAVFISEELAGFYMLRGFDQGYEVPSYGVWIVPAYSGMGLASFTLQHAFCFCRANSIKRLMLKVHPDNTMAKKIYERNGFKETGIDAGNNNLIFHRDI
ncbi:MAG: GNAT family N-acetyltransferase [Deltaproteobacteria bacterium]|nr:GNAT family N-acetyltransferase [Deltaproteobacteria bacterium]